MVANAGHPPAVVLRSDLSTEQLPWADGAPLGVGRRRRGLSRLSFRAGDTLVAFTDGLIERRDEDIEQGLKRVHEAMPAMAGSNLDPALDHLVAQLRRELHDDDVAAVAVRRTG
jgi:serine phosphatase RsbU (regulator of sigma subunit)